MDDLWNALLSAILGLIGGIAGAAAIERLKSGATSLDVEFVRLDNFEDDLFDVFACPLNDADRAQHLRRLAGLRRRLGQNIRRKILDSVAYKACSDELVKLDGFLGHAEDGVALTERMETDIQSSVRRLRNQLQKSSRTSKSFRLLRGEG